jgi:tripartite-type tricarboxylate transporter receptor subunit TctC
MSKQYAPLVAIMLLSAMLSSPIRGEVADYPTKPLSLIVPFPAGGRTDVVGRIIAQHLQIALGKPVAVINKPGASSVLGAKEVAASKPDGYTLGFFSTSAVTAQYTVPTPMSLKDYELIAIVNADPAALAVAEKAPWPTLRDFVAAARAKPGQFRIGMIPGASAQIFAAGFSRAAGIDLIQVPFKGDTDGAIALAGGHIDAHVAVPVAYKSLVDGKKVRILGVASDLPSPLYDNVTTFRNNGVDLVIGAFHGIFAPTGTPAPVIEKLAVAIQSALASPELGMRMNDVGAAVLFLRGDEAKAYLERQDVTYREVIEALGLRVAKTQ